MTMWMEVVLQSNAAGFDALVKSLGALSAFRDSGPVREREVTARHSVGVAMPGFARYRLVEQEGEAIDCVRWNIDAGNVQVVVTLDTRATLRLAAPATRDNLDVLFRLAREITDRAPFSIAASDTDSSNHEPVHADKLSLPVDATRREAFAIIAASIAAQWFGNVAAARAGVGDEHVHQLRVAQRRLKTLLKLFRHDLDDAWSTRIAPELKWFGDVLADARDWDVFTDQTLPAYAQSDDEPARWQPLIEAADDKRRAARDAVRDALASPRHAHLALAFIEWLARFEMREDDAPGHFIDFAKQRVRKSYKRITRVPDLTTLDAPARHRVRIHAKRLRYALDFFHSVATHGTRKQTAKHLSALQTVLGEANDAAVAARRLVGMEESSEYQRGFARAWGAALASRDAQEGERLLRAMRRPRLKASI